MKGKTARKAAKPARRAKKSAVKSAVKLIPQPHGGALAAGGIPGNPGGGRPRSEVRAAALEGAAEAIPKLRAMIETGDARPEVIVQAADKLLKYGLGTVHEISVDEVKGRLQRTVDLIRAELSPEDAARVLAGMRPIWVP